MSPSIECVKNVESLDDAVKNIFDFYIQAVYNEKLDTEMDVVPFLRYVQNNYTNQGTNKNTTIIKK